MSSVGSVYFNGGSVYSGANSSLILSGSFTIEFWFKSGNQSNQFNAAITQNAHIAGGVDIRINTNIQLLPNSGGSLYSGSRNNLNDNQWHNVAIVQNIGNNTLTVFIDGVQDGQNSNTSTWNYGTYGISLGQNPGYSSNWTGFLSNVRILNGTALYSSNYSVPTATYTAIPNTVFLFNANAPNNFEDSSPNNLTMLLRGTTTPVASIDKPNITLSPIPNPNFYPCFKEGSKILCLIDDMEVYVPIQNIRKGFLIKTFTSGYKPVCMIGHRKIYNPDNDLRFKNRLYKLTKDKYPSLFEELVLTGCHSLLVDRLTEQQEEDTREDVGKLYITETKYRLFTYLDNKAKTYEKEGLHEIWHLALENDDYYMNYGIWANGLLVETTSKSFMERFSGMSLV
jgi:hypothetical protein